MNYQERNTPALKHWINSLYPNVTEITIPVWRYKNLDLPRNIFLRFKNVKSITFDLGDDMKYNDRITLNNLPVLPSSLEELDCSHLNLKELPVLPESLKTLRCGWNKLKSLPSLPYNLETLHCAYNPLKELPPLPIKLKYLDVYGNKLTHLPSLPLTLKNLQCGRNCLTWLPNLPDGLNILNASHNELTCLPTLPSELWQLDAIHNKLIMLPELPLRLTAISVIFNHFPFDYIDPWTIPERIVTFRKKIHILNCFRDIFYAFKFKKQFRKWLWEKVREPKIRAKYHPDNLMKMLEGREDMDLDELDELQEKW